MDDEELTAEIQAQVDEWSSNSNECFNIRLVGGSNTESFQPEFTYPIFGEEEAIFGYQGLSILLSFAAHDLKPHLTVKFDKIFKALGEKVRPTDINEALRDFLPAEAFVSGTAKEALEDKTASQFVPPGQKIRTYTRAGEKFEIWSSSLADARAKQILERMGILVPMFIEGGTMLQLEQDWTTQRWKLFLVYKVAAPAPEATPTSSPYSLAGYGTSYRVFTLPDRKDPSQFQAELLTSSLESFLPPPDANIPNELAPSTHASNLHSPLDLPSRERISQFLVLPPYQGAGHGQELYNAMYLHLTSLPNVRELTVEDPSEAFDDLRDVCDLKYLRQHSPDFAALRINTSIPADKLSPTGTVPTELIVSLATRSRVMTDYKIMQRQFDRLVEMHTLSFIPPLHRTRARTTKREKATNEHDKAFYFWRMYVKQRLYIFNRDQLAQLDREERIEKLESAVDSVLEGFAGMLERVEAQDKEFAEAGDGEEARSSALPAKRKRKVVEEDEDEEEEAMDGFMQTEGDATTTNGYKKARVDDA